MELTSEWGNTLLQPEYLVLRQQILLNKSCTKSKLTSDSLAPMNIFFFSIFTNPFMLKFPWNRNSSSCPVSLILNILFCRLFLKVSMINLLGPNMYWCKEQRQVRRTVYFRFLLWQSKKSHSFQQSCTGSFPHSPLADHCEAAPLVIWAECFLLNYLLLTAEDEQS